MIKNETVEKIAEVITKFEEVEVGYIFGSSLLGKGADVDIALLVSEKLPPHKWMKFALEVARTLEKALGYKFELDVKVLNSSPTYFQYEVIKSGRVIFCRDEGKRVEYEASIISEYLDYKDVLEWFDKKLLARLQRV